MALPAAATMRLVLLLELLFGVAPVSIIYIYTFPAGASWTGRTVGLILRGVPNAYTIVMAAIFVTGGIGLAGLWAAMTRRLFGRGAPGRVLLAGILAGMAASIAFLAIDTMMGAYPLDYFVHGAPLLVATHQVLSAARPGRRGAAGVALAALALLGPATPAAAIDSPGLPRVPAEWEPTIGAMVAWPPIVPDTLLVEIAKDDLLFLLVADERARKDAEAAVGRLRIDPLRVRFIVAAAGDARPWPRDWGPFPLFDAQGAFRLADPEFVDYPITTPSCDGRLYTERILSLADFRPDDRATEAVARALALPRLPLPFGFTGGNALVDGLGTAFSTCVMTNENRRYHGLSREELGRLLATHLGITRSVVVPNFEWFGIQHVDCLLKPLDEETLLVKRVPERHPDHDAIEAIVRSLSALANPRGRPYRILRIDTPPYLLGYFTANYTNSLILNRKVLVPLFGIPADRDALETWRAAMPGHEVIGFENPGRDGWNWTDALHCRVRAVWDPEMLSMSHRRIDDPAAPADAYRVEAEIIDHSGAGLIRGEMNLWWRVRGEPAWRTAPLEPITAPHAFAAVLPSPGPGRTVEYYLAAADRSGRRETLPRFAPQATDSFQIAGANR